MNELEIMKLIQNTEKNSSLPELIETHISWIFLTEKFAYKFKKNVAFDFLDFSTYELRLKAAHNEIRLNRRLASDVYLDLLYITKARDGSYELNGSGRKVDILIKMKRLPSNLMLDQLIKDDMLTASHLVSISGLLNDFFMNQTACLTDPEPYVASLKSHVHENRSVLLDKTFIHLHNTIQSIHTAQLLFIDLEEKLLSERVAAGRIIEGHGDLRPEHICLQTDHPVIFDCIEFRNDFRVIDVIDELSFLAVECEQLGNEECGNYILHEYKEQCGDHPDARLIEFYKSYRASVRAKVAAIRSGQCKGEEFKRQTSIIDHYCRIAERHAKRLESQFVFITGGFMGTGKTTLARALADKYGAMQLHTDKIRSEYFDEQNRNEAYSSGKYSEENRQYVYDKLFYELEDFVQRGLSVVVDGSFQSEFERKRIQTLAEAYGTDFRIIWCSCPPEVAKKRIRFRSSEGNDASEATPDLVDRQLAVGSAPTSPTVINVDTTQSLAEGLETVRDALRAKYDDQTSYVSLKSQESYGSEFT